MNNVTADLETEVRRLRIRIIGLTTRQLDEAGASSPATTAGGRSRRDAIAEALAEFSSIGSAGRPVPELGDQSLADQVVVLIDEGAASAKSLPEAQRRERLTHLLDAAVGLRRAIA